MAQKNNDKNDDYLIPKRLVRQSTIAPGIGPKELGILSAGLLFSILLWFLLGNVNVLIRILIVIIPFAFTWLIVQPGSYNENKITVFIRLMNYKKSTQKFFYYKEKK